MNAREKEIFDKSVNLLVQELQPKKIYLFGSRAKGTARVGSDFDFAIDGSVPKVTDKWQIKGQLEAIAGLYSVDVVYLEEVNPKFKELILKTGKVVYEQR